ncbi:DUF305 domain-containing protein [Micromonospora echinofusca]|uniref:DUF305 domain-containing protein n=2 Tax=Micromonospora echinofusca TaxID=47858 RepID=A0ABS3VVI5_MICEH|nr:DUF305 domain-containing protein [Micromonospora echinofusca]
MHGTGDRHATPAGASTADTPTGPARFNGPDVMFAQMMIPHHRQAVEMSTLAETRATDPEVKQLAAQIKAAQQPEIDKMTGWLTAWGRPTAMPGTSNGPGMHHGGMPGMMTDAEMTDLAAASGTDFDRRFLTMMVAHHKGALTMARDEISSGDNAEAKALAQAILTSQQAEIDTMNRILARL